MSPHDTIDLLENYSRQYEIRGELLRVDMLAILLESKENLGAMDEDDPSFEGLQPLRSKVQSSVEAVIMLRQRLEGLSAELQRLADEVKDEISQGLGE